MFKSIEEFDKLIYEILIQIRDNEDPKSVLSKLGDINFDDAILRCVDIGLIEGLSFQKDACGNLFPSIQREIRLSYKGLAFIKEFES
mgnify:FL=1|jgi:hypothetical protein